VASLAFGEASSDFVGLKEPSLGAGYRVRARKIGLIEAGFEERDAESSSDEFCELIR